MFVMGKKKPRPNRTTVALNLYIRPDIAAALDSYLAEQRPSRTKVSTVETALEDFLKKAGHWPPPPAPG